MILHVLRVAIALGHYVIFISEPFGGPRTGFARYQGSVGLLVTQPKEPIFGKVLG